MTIACAIRSRYRCSASLRRFQDLKFANRGLDCPDPLSLYVLRVAFWRSAPLQEKLCLVLDALAFGGHFSRRYNAQIARQAICNPAICNFASLSPTPYSTIIRFPASFRLRRSLGDFVSAESNGRRHRKVGNPAGALLVGPAGAMESLLRVTAGEWRRPAHNSVFLQQRSTVPGAAFFRRAP
jgi:hypothetical protein